MKYEEIKIGNIVQMTREDGPGHGDLYVIMNGTNAEVIRVVGIDDEDVQEDFTHNEMMKYFRLFTRRQLRIQTDRIDNRVDFHLATMIHDSYAEAVTPQLYDEVLEESYGSVFDDEDSVTDWLDDHYNDLTDEEREQFIEACTRG